LDVQSKIDSNPLWYHTLELGADTPTPGWFDLRPIVDRLPWPDIRGKRCLDVGTYDGFLAFELERRGASEVVATDIEDHSRWDWPVRTREAGPAELAHIAGPQKGLGFEIAKEALGSSVERVERSVYDLTPAEDGMFDFVICGSLLLHLRNPVRALEAIRTVCGGSFLSAEQIDVRLTMLSRKRPVAWFRGGDLVQWWIPNAAAHRAIVESAGFRIVDKRRYRVPLGAGHPARRRPKMPYSALLAEPDV
jgi:SAM-dependent methyltransferase